MFKLIAFLILIIQSSFCFGYQVKNNYAAKINLLNEIKNSPNFDQFLKVLNNAIRRKDSTFIYRTVSKEFYLYRDFGGWYNQKSSNIFNFSGAFQLDNSKLGDEYQDSGWLTLSEAVQFPISNLKYSEFTNFEICNHSVALEQSIPKAKLCFTLSKNNKWLISSYIFSGD